MFENKESHKKNKDVVFMQDSESIRNDLDMGPSERNIGPTVVVVVVDKFFKSPLFVNVNKEVRGNGVAIEETREGHANDDILVEEFREER